LNRWVVLAFGVVSYLAAVRSLLYFVGFSTDRVVSRTVDSGPALGWASALAVDLGLLVGFALVHSLMARRPFKDALTRWVPAAVERSVYVFVAAVSLMLLMWLWRPIAVEIWNVQAPAGHVLFGVGLGGWLLAAVSLISVGHLELFGLRQAQAYFRGVAHHDGDLVTTGVYRRLRDPAFVGYCIGLWCAPRMTLGHFVLALGMTAYILIGARFERRDLIVRFGRRYLDYASKPRAVGHAGQLESSTQRPETAP